MALKLYDEFYKYENMKFRKPIGFICREKSESRNSFDRNAFDMLGYEICRTWHIHLHILHIHFTSTLTQNVNDRCDVQNKALVSLFAYQIHLTSPIIDAYSKKKEKERRNAQ